MRLVVFAWLSVVTLLSCAGPVSAAEETRWVLWRSSPSLAISEHASEQVQSFHDSLQQCDAALVRRFHQLRADGYTPSLSGARGTARLVLGGVGKELVSYRCVPEAGAARGAATK